MHSKFEAVVLDQVPYSDSSFVYRFLTKEQGIQSALAKGLKGKRGRALRPVLNRMNRVEVEVWKKGDSLPMLKNAQIRRGTAHQLNPGQGSVAIFLNEVLCKTVKDGNVEPAQYEMTCKLMQVLAESEYYVDLHIIFLLKFTRTLGAYPDVGGTGAYLDLLEGISTDAKPAHEHFLEGRMKTLFARSLGMDLAINANLGINNDERRSLLEKILEFYRLQLDEKFDLRSHKILHTVLQ